MQFRGVSSFPAGSLCSHGRTEVRVTCLTSRLRNADDTCCLREADVYNYLNSYFCGKVVINFRFHCVKFWKSDFTNSFMIAKTSSCHLDRENFTYQILVSYACHAKSLQSVLRLGSQLSLPDCPEPAEAKCFRMSSDTNIIYKNRLQKLALKTMNAVPVY